MASGWPEALAEVEDLEEEVEDFEEEEEEDFEEEDDFDGLGEELFFFGLELEEGLELLFGMV